MLQSLQPIIVQTFHVYAITFFFSRFHLQFRAFVSSLPSPEGKGRGKKKIIIIKEIHLPPFFAKFLPPPSSSFKLFSKLDARSSGGHDIKIISFQISGQLC